MLPTPTLRPRLWRLLAGGFAVAAVACAAPSGPAEVGHAAPDYGAVSVQGDSVRVRQLRGQVVLLNVWATWCVPCRVEIPELQALHQEYSAQGLRVLGVSVDDRGENASVAGFMRDFGMTYTVLRDPDERISAAFAIYGVPASFLIDRGGTIRWRHLGPFSSKDTTFLAALQAALKASDTT